MLYRRMKTGLQHRLGLTRFLDPRAFLREKAPQELELQTFFDGKMRFEQQHSIFDHPLFCLGFTNRSGSNLLGSYLRCCPPFSGFEETLNAGAVQANAKRLGAITLPDFIRRLSYDGRGIKPIFGFKASVEQLVMLQRHNIPAMYSGGLKLIEIRRDDLIGQAISYQIALQTGAWSSRVQPTTQQKPRCDPKGLHDLVLGIRAAQNRMDMFVECHSISRLLVRYEDLVRDPNTQLHRIAHFAGFDPEGWTVGTSSLQQQADATNDAFRTAFRKYLWGDRE